MKVIKISVILFLVMISQNISSQEYLNSVGFRAGGTSGFCCYSSVNDFKALEGIISFRNQGVQLTALIETFFPANININDNLFLYYGYGAHIGYSKKYDDNFLSIFEPNKSIFRTRPVIGVDAIFGIEYRFVSLPLIAAVDTKPYTEFFGFPFFKTKLFDLGISLKYIF